MPLVSYVARLTEIEVYDTNTEFSPGPLKYTFDL